MRISNTENFRSPGDIITKALGWMMAVVLSLAPPTAQARDEYYQQIDLVGLSCTAIQKDAIGNPDNEIFLSITINEPLGSGNVNTTLPRNGVWSGIKAGTVLQLNERVWSGKPQPVSLRIAMFEKDAGGKTPVQISLLMAAAVSAGRSGGADAGRYSVANTASQKAGATSRGQTRPTLADDDASENLIVSELTKVLNDAGLGDDFMGYQRVRLGEGDWWSQPIRKAGKISYHFSTAHTRGGANCRAYFRFSRGDRIIPTKATPIASPRDPGIDSSRPGYQPPFRPAPVSDAVNAGDTQVCEEEYRVCVAEANSCIADHNSRYRACSTQFDRDRTACYKKYHPHQYCKRDISGRCPIPNLSGANQCTAFDSKAKVCGVEEARQCRQPFECANRRNMCQSNAFLSGGGSGSDGYPGQTVGPDPDYGTVAPPPPPPPPATSLFGSFKNRCKVPVSVAFAYKDGDGGDLDWSQWTKEGWSTLKPGQKFDIDFRSLHPGIFIYTSRGRVKNTTLPFAKPSVHDKAFSVPLTEKLTGPGSRVVTFNYYKLRPSKSANKIEIDECDAYNNGKFIPTANRANATSKEKRAAAQNTLFDLAWWQGSGDKVDLAVQQGADVNAKQIRSLHEYPTTPLQLAMERGAVDVAKALLRNGADPTVIGPDGRTLFHLLALNNNQRSTYWTKEFPVDLMKDLIARGVDPNIRDKDGRTALGAMKRQWPVGLMELEIKNGYKPHDDGDILIFLAKRAPLEELNKPSDAGYTLLQVAANSGHEPLARLLLEQGVDKTYRTFKYGMRRTAYDYSEKQPESYRQLFLPDGKQR